MVGLEKICDAQPALGNRAGLEPGLDHIVQLEQDHLRPRARISGRQKGRRERKQGEKEEGD